MMNETLQKELSAHFNKIKGEIKMNTQEKVIDKLKGKTVSDYHKELIEAENKLLECLEELPNWQKECGCEDEEKEICKIVYEGSDFDEIQIYDINCGGYATENDWS